MNKRYSSAGLLLAVSLFAGNPVSADEDFEAKCQKWAVEDDVPQDEKEDYIKSCVQNLIDQQQEKQSEGGESDAKPSGD